MNSAMRIIGLRFNLRRQACHAANPNDPLFFFEICILLRDLMDQMNEFSMLANDFGFRPQGKFVQMKSSVGDRQSSQSLSSATFTADGNDIFNEVFSGTPKYTNTNFKSTSSMSDFDYDSIFKDWISNNNNEAKMKHTSSNSPIYDKSVYDDDIFDGLHQTGINFFPEEI
ncbi:hypothetical protein L1887_12519 [Cichorium endivia]|nr:hypothetical protein L1887_12519 [Cichorium endivia]